MTASRDHPFTRMVLREHQKWIMRYLKNRSASLHKAETWVEDVFQEIMLRVLNYEQKNPGKVSVIPSNEVRFWLFKIVKNTFSQTLRSAQSGLNLKMQKVDFQDIARMEGETTHPLKTDKRKKIEKMLEMLIDPSTLEDKGNQKELEGRLRESFRKLDPSVQKAILLSLNGMTVGDIVKKIPELKGRHNAGIRMTNALRQLREKLTPPAEKAGISIQEWKSGLHKLRGRRRRRSSAS